MAPGTGGAPPSDKQEVAALQTAQSHVLQHDGVVRINGDHGIIALLLAEREDGLEVGDRQRQVIKLDVISVPEVGDHVVPEASGEHKRIATVTASEGVIAGTTVKPVIVVATGERVIAAPTEQRIVAIACRNGVVAV